jgi:hypothetical protein
MVAVGGQMQDSARSKREAGCQAQQNHLHGPGSAGVGSPRVLLIAEAFGFGPASKLIALLHRSPSLQKGHSTFIGHGSALALAHTGRFDRVIEGDPCNLEQGSPMRKALRENEVLVSAMEFGPLAMAKGLGLRTILFDSLFWMWPEVESRLRDVDVYLCQNFLGVEERVASLDSGPAVVVPPVTVAGQPGWSPEDFVVLNFGGMLNPYVTRSKILTYVETILHAAQSACRAAGHRLEIYGVGSILEDVRGIDQRIVSRMSMLPPQSFVERLRRARSLMTSPGLEVLYEAFTVGVPTFMLPPQNNSQAYQAARLRQRYPALAGIDWHELLPVAPLPEMAPPDEAIPEILGRAEGLRDCSQARELLCQCLTRFLQEDLALHTVRCDSQAEFLRDMSRDLDTATISAGHLFGTAAVAPR